MHVQDKIVRSIFLGAPGLPGLGGQKGIDLLRSKEEENTCLLVSGDLGFSGLPGQKGESGQAGNAAFRTLATR